MVLSLKKFVPVPLKRAIKNLLGLQTPAKPKSVSSAAKPVTSAAGSPKKRTGGNKKAGAGTKAPRPRAK